MIMPQMLTWFTLACLQSLHQQSSINQPEQEAESVYEDSDRESEDRSAGVDSLGFLFRPHLPIKYLG